MTGSLDILFINPPYERLKGFTLGSLPNGILGLATFLNKKGFNSLVYDADTNAEEGLLAYNNKNRAESQNEYAKNIDDKNHPVWAEIKETIERLDPHFVGITLMTPTLHSGLMIARIAKKLKKIVLVGGPHINIINEKALEIDCVDFAFFGEAEYSVTEFLNSYPDNNKLRDLKGLGFKNGLNTYYNGFSDRIENLDELPHPDRDLLVYKERYQVIGLSTIMASRGCPFKCSFCASVPIWKQNVAFRSPEHIVEEIKSLHFKYKTRTFRFFDDTFTAKKSNVIKLCKVLIGVFGDNFFSWSCLSKVSAIDDEVLSWLRRAGCNEIHLGVESGSDKILKRMHKGITLKQVEKAVQLSKNYNFWVHTFFMIGLPYETLEDMRSTINFMKKIKPDSINLCTFTPYPGTELYNYCVDRKLIEHDDNYEMFLHVGHHSTTNYFLEFVDKDDYKKVLDEILELTTKISNSITYKKFMFRVRRLTLDKIARKLQIKTKAMLLKFSTN